MGFLDRLRASQRQHEAWKELTELRQLANISVASKDKPVVIFKHSTTCGISANAKHRLEIDWEHLDSHFEFYYLDLLKYRSISNSVEQKWNVRHESPQIIIIKDDIAVYNTSHGMINIDAIVNNL